MPPCTVRRRPLILRVTHLLGPPISRGQKEPSTNSRSTRSISRIPRALGDFGRPANHGLHALVSVNSVRSDRDRDGLLLRVTAVLLADAELEDALDRECARLFRCRLDREHEPLLGQHL